MSFLKADDDYNTVVFIKNETDQPKKYVANLIYEGGGYSSGVKELKPRQTVVVDFKTLRDNQTPDSTGKLIPLNIDRGQIAWSMNGKDNKTVSGRSEQVNTVRGVSSTYACYNCCPDSFASGRVTPSDVFNYPSDVTQFAAMETDANCFGYSMPERYADIPSFTSSDYNVAHTSTYGSATAMSPGLATIFGSWTAATYRLDIHGYSCEYTPVEVVEEGYMEVGPDIILTVPEVVMDGDTVEFRVRVENGTATAYEWSFDAPSGSGNNPQVNFTAPNAAVTQAKAHWFAKPDSPCGADFNSRYTIKVKVTFQNGGSKTKEAPFTVSVGRNWGGTVPSPVIDGYPDTNFDSQRNLWVVTDPEH